MRLPQGAEFLVVILPLLVIALIVWVVVRRSRRSTPNPYSAPSAAAAVPGWYADPGGTGRMRWFDGTVWTDNYGDAGTPPPPAAR